MQDKFHTAWQRVKSYTVISPECGLALWQGIHSILDHNIFGAFVECEVGRGGSAMLMALALQARGEAHREIVLFDTFAGVPSNGAKGGNTPEGHTSDMVTTSRNETGELTQASSSIDDVRSVIASTGYDMRLVRFVQGDVALTLPKAQTLQIALLSLKTGPRESTFTQLTNLYPRLATGGLLFFAGHGQTPCEAVEDYFSDNEHEYHRPMFWIIDDNARGAVKIDAQKCIEIERYDYIPPGMTPPDLLPFFPHASPQNPWPVNWPYLRKHIPHIWRSDSRNTGYTTGYSSVEEAACLYSLAKLCSGKRGLEIGSHFGWTAAHLLAAGLILDCIDPAFEDEKHAHEVSTMLSAVRQTYSSGNYRLWPGKSPDLLAEARASSNGAPWSFAFIDGNHDGDAPANDARAVLPHLADDAIVVFHDLVSPYVAQGLKVFHEAGFATQLFNTMQILGVAWRGNITIPEHIADTNNGHIFIAHLAEYLDH